MPESICSICFYWYLAVLYYRHWPIRFFRWPRNVKTSIYFDSNGTFILTALKMPSPECRCERNLQIFDFGLCYVISSFLLCYINVTCQSVLYVKSALRDLFLRIIPSAHKFTRLLTRVPCWLQCLHFYSYFYQQFIYL